MAAFAVSYDPVSVLAAFAEKRGVTYPLLSDEGSHAIRALGLLNTHLDQQHAHYGGQTRDYHHGVPYPGTFVLDEDGIVVEKHFEQSYRVRPTAAALVETSFGGESTRSAARAQAETEDLRITVWSGSATYRPYQKLRLDLDIEIAPGLHVYGQPVPDGYTPLTVAIDPLEALEAGPVELPAPRPFQVEGLDEQFLVYEGTVRGSIPVVLFQNLGDVTLTLRVRYQACSESLCYPPTEVTLPLLLTGLENIRD
ncbi:MAG: redoxin domain-containing protein [Chloroflexi bacterium]|nr:redoxin domain-containing protein [Chloroflexota bacterium]